MSLAVDRSGIYPAAVARCDRRGCRAVVDRLFVAPRPDRGDLVAFRVHLKSRGWQVVGPTAETPRCLCPAHSGRAIPPPASPAAPSNGVHRQDRRR